MSEAAADLQRRKLIEFAAARSRSSITAAMIITSVATCLSCRSAVATRLARWRRCVPRRAALVFPALERRLALTPIGVSRPVRLRSLP